MYKLVVVTPERVVFDGEVKSIVARTISGDIGILKGHIGYVTPLDTGELKVNFEDKTRIAAVSGGFLRVGKDQTTILTDTCEWADEIDLERAKLAEEKAKKKLADKSVEADIAELKLKRAINRIRVASR